MKLRVFGIKVRTLIRSDSSAQSLESINKHDGERHFKVTSIKKVNSGCFKLYRSYSISFNFVKRWRMFLKLKKKKKKIAVLCSRPP